MYLMLSLIRCRLYALVHADHIEVSLSFRLLQPKETPQRWGSSSSTRVPGCRLGGSRSIDRRGKVERKGLAPVLRGQDSKL